MPVGRCGAHDRCMPISCLQRPATEVAVSSVLAPPPLTFTEFELDGPQRGVAVTGELDVASAPALRVGLEALVESCPQRLVVDLSELDFVDASGVATLLATREGLRRHGGTMRTICPDPHVRRTFELTGTVALVGLVDGRDGTRTSPSAAARRAAQAVVPR